MNTIRPCGCKGVRTCLQCEKDFNIEKPSLYEQFKSLNAYTFCPDCQHLYKGWNTEDVLANHPQHDGLTGIKLPGIFVQKNFITDTEGVDLMKGLDSLPWTISQSGRRKQNYGPKTNFKKRKIQLGAFNGFPAFSKYLQTRFNEIELLKDFQTIEQCSLEYEPLKGACIDPHIDDCWIWGERVVTVNCLGDTTLTLTPYNIKNVTKYNLDLVSQYESKLIAPFLTGDELSAFENCVIRVSMPNLSLIVLYGPARYQFEHAVLREDVGERRVCVAYREFTPMYIDGEDHEKGDLITQAAQNFW